MSLVTLCSNILAIPLAIIFNLITRTGQWPASWSTEIVTIIPNNNDPANIMECQNLASTPLFSKVMEAYVLDRLRKETKFEDSQYGGIKEMGVDHFLVKT